MIVELCGMPGSGKTTIVESLKLKTTNIIDRNEFLLQKTIRFRIIKKVVYFSFFKFPILKSTKILKKFLSEYPLCETKYINRLLDMYIAFQTAKKNDIYFLDEGAIQYITSVCYDSHIVLNDSLKQIIHLFYKRNKAIVCFLSVDIQTSIERIKKRDFSYDRYNLADIEIMRSLLKLKEANLKATLEVAKNIKAIEVVEFKDIEKHLVTKKK